MRSVARIPFAFAIWMALLVVMFVTLPQSAPAAAKSRNIAFDKQVAPLLDKYCYSCHGHGKHKGDVALDTYK